MGLGFDMNSQFDVNSQYRQLLRRNVKRFRGGLVCKANRLLRHSALGSRVIRKKSWASGCGESLAFLYDPSA